MAVQDLFTARAGLGRTDSALDPARCHSVGLAVPDAPLCGQGERVPDLVVLLALGMAHRQPVRFAGIAAALGDLDLAILPCADVAYRLVQGLVSAGYLTGSLDEGAAITPTGMQAFTRLMTQRLEQARTGSGRGLVRLRMAFLDLLTLPLRCAALERILVALECDAEGLTSSFEDHWAGPWGGRWVLRDLSASADDLRLVRAMLLEARQALADPAMALAAE